MKFCLFPLFFGIVCLKAFSQVQNLKVIDLNEVIAQKIDSLNHESHENPFKGSIIVVKGKDVIINQHSKPFDKGYWIGSLTKHFTATAILQLQENQKLSVNDSIHKFIPGVPFDKKGITIHHLLTHTSGLANNYILD